MMRLVRAQKGRRGVFIALAVTLLLMGMGRSYAAPQYTPIIYSPAPSPGAVVQGSSVRLGATIRSDNGNPISSWQVTIDGSDYQMVQPVVSADGLTVQLYNFVPLSNGPHNIYVKGVDSAGVAGGYAWSFTVQGSNPATPTPVPPSGSGLPAINGLTPAAGATVTAGVVRVAATLASSGNLTNETIAVDGRQYQILGKNGGKGETIYVDISGLTVGQHNVVVQASDTLGNFNARGWSFTVQLCAPGLLYFPQTGHCVSTGFYQFWQQNGGLTTFGYPISDEIAEVLDDGKTYSVQYFERARFEYHPDAPDPYKVQLGLLGKALHPPDARVAPYNGRRYFNETGHGVADDFLNFWLNNGGVAILGYPISEEQSETEADGKSYVVQYFERARLERHPENAAPYNVLAGQLGRQVYQQKHQ